METTEKIILLCLMGFFGAITPGPDILLVLKTTLRFGMFQGLKVLLGIASGWCLYLALIYAGFSHWLNTPILQLILSFVGGFYLLYLAYLTLSASSYTYNLNTEEINNIRKDGFIQGLILNLSNPKAILFFIFLVTPFIEEGMKIGLIALWCSLFSAFMLVIICASIIKKYMNAKIFSIIDTLCGVLFVCFGWLLCFECGLLSVKIYT
ncbi:LysE family translocator [Helicobacter sp. MIT 21-1697]|uniref:LysE family translocator n=1 Tax=Helicobacter sp. MIT 21-1697 TaxID=2993733 RepID=UPI00224B42E1|nr:LysE family translocator [Helicobacter sp. MIT 21-1697]MCX2717256.1 LysE family translocator [Helicobacter sp. MIT 21-1697]